MSANQFTAVCPLIRDDLDRFEILLRSLDRFCSPDSLRSLLVVVKADELAELEQVKDFSATHRVEVFSEDELDLPTQLDSGWYRQQLIKLRVATRVTTPFYLTLDADVICCRPVTHARLVPDGRALMTRKARDKHPDWWRQSARILGVRPLGRIFSPRLWPPRLFVTGPGMAVTPALLSTTHVRELMQFIEDKWQAPLGDVLSRNPFTEYTLYYLFLEMRGLVDTVHNREHPVLCRGRGANVWYADQFETWEVDGIFTDPDRAGFFTVCQSSAEIPVEQVWARIERFVPRA